jgi:type I restriction enzyme, S subunit
LGYEVSKEFPSNTIVMSIAANIADVAILTFNACFPDSVIGFKPFENIDADFLFYHLKNLRNEFYRISTKSTQYNLNVERVKNVSIFLPPKTEQIEIVTHIEKETALLTQTINTIEREIALVQEYRTTLIAEAVTGKIDVRQFTMDSGQWTIEEDEAETEVEMGLDTEGSRYSREGGDEEL